MRRPPLTASRRPSLVQGFALSAFLHGGALALAAGWSVWNEDERAAFSGRRQVIYAEFSAAPSVEAPPPVEISPTPPASPVVITPERAELEHRRLVDTPSADVDPVELAAVDPTLAAPPAATPPAPSPPRHAARTNDAQATDAPPVVEPPDAPRPLDRAPSPVRPPSAAAAAAPPPDSSLGVEADESPSFAGNRPPKYPELARRNRWEGVVLLELTVDEEGRVAHVRVVESSGHPVLDAAAVAAIRQWQGRPARRAGRPVATQERLPVRFRL